MENKNIDEFINQLDSKTGQSKKVTGLPKLVLLIILIPFLGYIDIDILEKMFEGGHNGVAFAAYVYLALTGHIWFLSILRDTLRNK